jgi:hypothetical protein
MMPTGCHAYKVGLHKKTQPGAFRQQRALLVRRTLKTKIYSPFVEGNVFDDLDGGLPYNDIHSAAYDPHRSNRPFFSSAGCQVVKGCYVQGKPIGPWADFRVAAGLERQPRVASNGSTPEDGRRFNYVLATGREMRALSLNEDAMVRSLRFGAEGQRVAALQRALTAVNIIPSKPWKSGIFDRPTMEGVILWQRKFKRATGIVTAEDARKLQLVS